MIQGGSPVCQEEDLSHQIHCSAVAHLYLEEWAVWLAFLLVLRVVAEHPHSPHSHHHLGKCYTHPVGPLAGLQQVYSPVNAYLDILGIRFH